MNEVEGLWELYRKEKDCKVSERMLMVIWSAEGRTSYEIGDRLNCPHTKVLYWLNRYRAEGIDGLKTRKRSGKPSKLSDEGKEAIKVRLRSKEFWKTQWVVSIIKEEAGITYSERQVIRLLHRCGFERITPRKEHEKASEKEKGAFKKGRGSYWIRFQ
jgi:putative transposase